MLVTGGWDRNIRVWDIRSPTPAVSSLLNHLRVGVSWRAWRLQLSVACPERVYAMDAKYPLMVVACADKKIYLFNLDNPQRPFRVSARKHFLAPFTQPRAAGDANASQAPDALRACVPQ